MNDTFASAMRICALISASLLCCCSPTMPIDFR